MGAKQILIHLDLSDREFKLLRTLPPEPKLRWTRRQSMYLTESPETIGLKPLSEIRQANFPRLNLSTRRFEPEVCGPTELSLSECANTRHVTIRPSGAVTPPPHFDDDDPPRGAGVASSAAEFIDARRVIFLAVTLVIRRSIADLSL